MGETEGTPMQLLGGARSYQEGLEMDIIGAWELAQGDCREWWQQVSEAMRHRA